MKDFFTEHQSSGVISILVGVMVLVFAGVGLIMLVDSDFTFSSLASNSDEVRKHNDSLRGQINNLEIRSAVHQRKAAEAAKHREQAKLRLELEKQAKAACMEADILRQLIKCEKKSIEIIFKGKEAHRLKYRDHTRAAAIGKTYDKISTRLGKEYHNVHITGVSPLGVSISHSNGASCLGFKDMPAAWSRELMYRAAEVVKAMADEKTRESEARLAITKRSKELRKVMKNTDLRNQIALLRRQIAVIGMKYSSASTEASLARSKLNYNQSLRLSKKYASSSYRRYDTRTGNYKHTHYRPRYRITHNGNTSVPSSLETWQQRASRYERAAAVYAVQLASLRSNLSSLDPSYVLEISRQIQPSR